MNPHHSPLVYVANAGAIMSTIFTAHISEFAGVVSIILNVAILYRMFFSKKSD